MATKLTTQLAEFARTVQPSDLVSDVLKLSLLDWLSVAIAGQDQPVARSVLSLAREEAGKPEAFLFGADQMAPARMAALVNGTIGHALDYDDTHFAHIGHPSAVVLPAVLAISQSRGLSGKAMQDAAVIGAEASVRIGQWLGRSHYQIGYHQTATAGAFGAGLAAARLLGFDQAQTEATLGLLSTRVSGLKSQFGSMGKPFNAGLAAANAVEAAQLISHGFQPNSAGFEGAQGFGETHSGEGNLADATDGLGVDWRFETVSHKFHACCHGLHAALEAFRAFRGQADKISDIQVKTNPRWLRVCNNENPADGLECKFSYRHVLAMAAYGHDTSGIGAYTSGSATDPQLTAFRGCVEVAGDDDIPETGAELRVRFADGTVQQVNHDLNTPMGLDEKTARIVEKSSRLIGQGKAAKLKRLIDNFGSVEEISAVIKQ